MNKKSIKYTLNLLARIILGLVIYCVIIFVLGFIGLMLNYMFGLTVEQYSEGLKSLSFYTILIGLCGIISSFIKLPGDNL